MSINVMGRGGGGADLGVGLDELASLPREASDAVDDALPPGERSCSGRLARLLKDRRPAQVKSQGTAPQSHAERRCWVAR